MEYALYAFFYIFQSLFNTFMKMPVDKENDISMGTVFIACMILYTFFKLLGFIDSKFEQAKNSEG